MRCVHLASRRGGHDGVYFAVPEGWSEDERRAVAEVAALVRPEFEGRYAAMLSHEPKNYALLVCQSSANPARPRAT
jgi:hypothetical protein